VERTRGCRTGGGEVEVGSGGGDHRRGILSILIRLHYSVLFAHKQTSAPLLTPECGVSESLSACLSVCLPVCVSVCLDGEVHGQIGREPESAAMLYSSCLSSSGSPNGRAGGEARLDVGWTSQH
jgi:hypothetical protein